MIFSVGHKVVVNVNGTYKVGVVHSKTKLKKGWVYSINLEDGKMLERASVNKDLSQYIIHRGLSKQLNNDNWFKEVQINQTKSSKEVSKRKDTSQLKWWVLCIGWSRFNNRFRLYDSTTIIGSDGMVLGKRVYQVGTKLTKNSPIAYRYGIWWEKVW